MDKLEHFYASKRLFFMCFSAKLHVFSQKLHRNQQNCKNLLLIIAKNHNLSCYQAFLFTRMPISAQSNDLKLFLSFTRRVSVDMQQQLVDLLSFFGVESSVLPQSMHGRGRQAPGQAASIVFPLPSI